MGKKQKKKCRHCRKLFIPDPRNRNRQNYCTRPECRQVSKTVSHRRWLNKPENRDHFCGSVNVQRVQEWRKRHPGYWKRPHRASALQDSCQTQLPEIDNDTATNAANALQDILTRQPLIIIGLISNFIGSTLQDDIAATLLRMQQSGKDILYCQPKQRGGPSDCQNPDYGKTNTQNSKELQLDRSPTGEG